MHSIVFNYDKNSGIIGNSESLTLRCAYIISDFLATAGTSFKSILYDSIFSRVKLEMKVKIIESRLDEELKILGATGEQMIWFIKQHKKLKHPTPQEIILYKKLEKNIESIWKIHHESMLKKLNNTGLPQLEPFLLYQEMGVICVSEEDAELEAPDSYPISKILTLSFGERADNDILFLTIEFFNEKFYSQLTDNQKPLYLEPVFTFPNLNALNIEELKAVKSNISKTAQPFHEKVNEWIQSCMDKTPEESRDFFYNDILPVAKLMNDAIALDPILKHTYNKLLSNASANVLMGEVPISTVWDFFHHFKVIPPESKKKLDKLRTDEAYINKRIPVLFTKKIPALDDLETNEDESANDSNMPISTRKTLDIDE